MRLNDGIDPTARRAIADIGLLFVILLHFGAKLFKVFVRRLSVTALAGAGENREDGVGGLGSAHHGVTRVRPGDDKSWIIGLSTHRVVSSAE